MEKISATDVLIGIRSAMDLLTIQGAKNAQILAGICNDLEAVITAINNEKAKGGKADDSTEDTGRDV